MTGDARTRRTRRRGPVVVAALALLGLLAAATARASDVPLTGAHGHPRDRFPLAIHVESAGNPTLDAAARRAVRDWNAVTRDALGVTAFVEVPDPGPAQVLVTFEPHSGRLMGVAQMSVGPAGIIDLPVRIAIFPAKPRGETPADVLLYQVLAHELGHALGLPHTSDPRSLMCCVAGSIDFSDPQVRDAYVEARRHPDIGSVRAQLVEQYARVWPAIDPPSRPNP